jgi:outer membrane protein assembly factor BamB
MHRPHRLVRLLVVAVALVALLAAAGPAQAASGDWWQFGYTAAGTRFNPNETTIGAANVARLVVGAEQVPTFGAGATFAHASAVAVAGGRVLVATGNGLRAVDATTGAQRWNVAVAALGAPAAASGVRSPDTDLYAAVSTSSG